MTVYRPELHATAERGILEGPAGIYRTGAAAERVWNMFYQYRPTPDAPSRWGHEISEGDLQKFVRVPAHAACLDAAGPSASVSPPPAGAPRAVGVRQCPAPIPDAQCGTSLFLF